MINISLNKQLDYEVYSDFHNLSFAGVDFGQQITTEHPDIVLENYKKYIDELYTSHSGELEERSQQINDLLSRKQQAFFEGLTNLFKIDFSEQVFQGYLSVFNCNPRWPESKTFQIYYKKDLAHMLEVACHESLHFAFFDYVDKNFTEQTKNLNKNSGLLWELSEIFNIIILNLPQFRAILEMEEKLFYPDLQEKLEKARVLWNSTQDVDNFISRYLAELK